MRNNIRFYIGLIASGFLASSALAQSTAVIPSPFLPGDRAIGLSSGDQIVPDITSGGNVSLTNGGTNNISTGTPEAAPATYVAGFVSIAYGPDGLTQSLAALLSPAYQSSSITVGGPMNASGQILAQLFIGNSPRLMRLTPASFCASNCVRVSKIQMRGKFVQDPTDPGHCSPTLNAYNKVLTRVTVTNEAGTPLSGFRVRGRFLDDYWTNKPVSATTNAMGQASFSNKGPCGVGAVAFLVDSATKGTQTLDMTAGTLSNSVIPQ